MSHFDYCEPSLGHDGCELIVGHIDGALELGGVLSAEGWRLAIGPVQDGLRGTDTETFSGTEPNS
jgi:hypothetical protein